MNMFNAHMSEIFMPACSTREFLSLPKATRVQRHATWMGGRSMRFVTLPGHRCLW